MSMKYRPLAKTGLKISEIAFGAWPIAGLTSPGVTDEESLAAIRECFDEEDFLDAVHVYGPTADVTWSGATPTVNATVGNQ